METYHPGLLGTQEGPAWPSRETKEQLPHACCQRCGGEQRVNMVSWTREGSRSESTGQFWDEGLALDYCSACPGVELLADV